MAIFTLFIFSEFRTDFFLVSYTNHFYHCNASFSLAGGALGQFSQNEVAKKLGSAVTAAGRRQTIITSLPLMP
jgi:hypothetical protein